MPTYPIDGLDGLRDFARRLAGRVAGGQVYLMRGELGAGKTTLVRELCAALGVPPGSVVSPTFTLVQEYSGGRLPVVHVDLYRVQPGRELDTLDLEERLGDPGCVCFVEWPDAARALLPPGAVELRIDFGASETTRRITTGFELPPPASL